MLKLISLLIVSAALLWVLFTLMFDITETSGWLAVIILSVIGMAVIYLIDERLK